MKKHGQEFSKWLLIQESVLIWVISISFIVLSFYCVINQYFGELPWLAAMVGFPWAAYGVSQTYYYKKATAENTKGGIQYQNLLNELSEIVEEYQSHEDQSGLDEENLEDMDAIEFDSDYEDDSIEENDEDSSVG